MHTKPTRTDTQGSMPRRILHLGLMFYSNCFEILKKLSLNLHFGSEFQWGNGIFSGDLGDLIQKHPLPGSLPIIHITSDGFSKACSSTTCISLPPCHPGTTLHPWKRPGHRHRENQGWVYMSRRVSGWDMAAAFLAFNWPHSSTDDPLTIPPVRCVPGQRLRSLVMPDPYGLEGQ